jgi:hypothetical protein
MLQKHRSTWVVFFFSRYLKKKKKKKKKTNKKNAALSEKDRCALSLRPPLACGVPATKLRVRWKCENQEQIRVWCTSETDLNRQAATYYIIYQEAAAQE